MYNNFWQTSTMISFFKALFGYHPQMFYKDKFNPESKSWVADKNAVALHDLVKELKVNLTEL